MFSRLSVPTLALLLAAAGPSAFALVARDPVEASSSASALEARITPPPVQSMRVRADPGPTQMTITVVNKHGKPISTVHGDNPGPTPVAGKTAAGTIAVGATAEFAAPTNWAGNVQLVEYGDGRAIVGDESWIEGSLMNWAGTWMVGVDVSYVNGFSVPITCSCSSTKKFLSGCSKDLWSLGKCAEDNGKGSCKNPMRPSFDNKSAAPFFQPCAGKAYSYPSDDLAMSEGMCQDGKITCCVGKDC